VPMEGQPAITATSASGTGPWRSWPPLVEHVHDIAALHDDAGPRTSTQRIAGARLT